MNIWNDKRVVLTLDAGGTNFVFSAMKSGEEIVEPIRKPSNADQLDLCLQTIIDGFQEVLNIVEEKPVAISFAFPGPADYKNGIIGDLPNLPAFRGGVALGPMLQEHFSLPVFINNDGDLFAYGEALGGVLPEINKKLEEANSPKRYKNILGVTLGTGFGGGLVRNEELFIGDNSIATEVWLTSSRLFPERFAEEGISTRAIQRVFLEKATGKYSESLMPKDVYDVSIIVGGLTGAHDLYMPAALKEMNGNCYTASGESLPRLVQKVYNIDNDSEFVEFAEDKSKAINIPGTDKTIKYDPNPSIAICSSKLGASKAIGIGAYAFALKNL